MITADERLAYFAGFFDGEGNIQVAHHGRSYFLRISATQVDPTPLRMLQERFGGYLYMRPRKRGTDGYNRQPIWDWIHTGPRAASILRALLPYLVVKAAAAELGLQFQASKRPDGGPLSRRRLDDWEMAERMAFAEALAVRVNIEPVQ